MKTIINNLLQLLLTMGLKPSTVLCCSPEQHSMNLLSNDSSMKAYPDDEPLILSNENDPSCSLQFDRLEVNFKSYTSQINLSKSEIQEFPCLLQLSPPEIPERQGLDLVFVIEISANMNHHWLESVQKCLRYSVKQLNKCDRISIVVFNDTAVKLIPLTSVTSYNHSKITNTFNLIQGTGGCNLSEGLNLGLRILGMRRMCNTISSLIIFSKCDQVLEKLKEMFQNAEISTNFFLNVFGLGEHSTEVLSSLFSESVGNYYNVPHPSTLFQAFGSCFGDLTSLYVDGLKIDVELIRSVVPISLEKIYEHRSYITYGKPLHICVLLNIMPCSISFKQHFQLKLIKFLVKYRIVPSGEEVREEFVFELPLYSHEFRCETVEVNYETVVELYRFKFAEILNEILYMDAQTASLTLAGFWEELEKDRKAVGNVCVEHIKEECKVFQNFLSIGWNPALKARIICSMHGFINKSLFYYEDFQNSSQLSHQSSLKELSESKRRV